MESNSGESVTPDLSAETPDEHSVLLHKPRISEYVRNQPLSTNTKLFSVLALLNAHDPESKLDFQDCQQILGPPDPSHGEPPFEERMEPFSCFITVSSGAVHVINTDVAKSCLELLADLNIGKNVIVKDCIELLCEDKVQPHTVSSLRNVLTGSNVVETSKDVSLRLTKEIMGKDSMALRTTTTESSSERTVTSNINQMSFLGFFFCLFKSDIFVYVEDYPDSDNTKLFSILALLNTYLPNSYLLMKKCQQILDDSSLEEKMKPFLSLDASRQCLCLIHPDIANRSLEQLADLEISRSAIASKCIASLCGDQAEPFIGKLMKKLLTEREKKENGRSNFSTLIEDILKIEGHSEALDVLIEASRTFQDKFIYPQTIARLYYQNDIDYKEAEDWANEAISRDSKNSYTADTLGQVYKNWLKEKTTSHNEVNDMAEKGFEAFRSVEKKAKDECDDETNSFNNRGHFGFIQVAKIVSEKHECYYPFREKLKSEVKDKFGFFEWYLSYSNLGKPHKTTVEPDFFWREVASCYKKYTAENAADSTSFPALLDCLNHGLFVSKEKRAFKSGVTEKTRQQLEQTRDELKTAYNKNVDDVKVAERYILSNIILSNKEPHSPQHALVRKLQKILKRHMFTVVNQRHPEFYLLILLLFWPEEQLRDQTLEEANTGKESEQPSSGLNYNLEEYVTLMEKAYLEVYHKYLRGRYLLPKFFLGKGSGLSRWIHRSRLDAVVELVVDAELGNAPNRNRVKRKKINEMWTSWKVWQLPQIQELLQPLSDVTCTVQSDAKATVRVGEEKIKVRTECKSGTSAKSPEIFYLGFDIRGPVVFKVPKE
ncbi:PREDICTED: sterile alpha motif domain-containing protein 9-like [Poecilia mexicana]|uniref:sterile alpha motif domain-containing protein 9-like n=1 Tax=Poecilia mexicana TaxID=48701 RepID=UPI00072DE5C8|nr:PREDICTED: sterile alpha motif domain-containing protein 9-like [Poecilia mexicana]